MRPWDPFLPLRCPLRKAKKAGEPSAAAKGRLAVVAGAQMKHVHRAVTDQLWEAPGAPKSQVGACKVNFPGEQRPQALPHR